MKNLFNYKTGITLLKLTIVLGAAYYVYKRVFWDMTIDAQLFFLQIDNYLLQNWQIWIWVIIMSLINWLLEVKKWQVLVSKLQIISFFQALKQSLSSHTLSLITPFKLGEYAGKALYYTKPFQKRIVLLNLIGNTAQLFFTLLFGLIGLLFFITKFEFKIDIYKLNWVVYLIVGLILVLFVIAKLHRSNEAGYYKKVLLFFKGMGKQTKSVILMLSFLRYLVFSHQFYFLLLVFGIEIPYLIAMLLIATMYFLATLLPIFSLFDFVIKGSIAIYLFSFLGIDEPRIITISTLMWLLNFALPAMIGGFFVFSYKPDFKTKFAG